jgi:hypothetical protein
MPPQQRKLRRYAAGAGACTSHSSRLVEGIACLDDGNLPVTSRGINGVSSWGTAERFEFVRNLGSSEIWAWKADRLSWDAMALLGCAPKPKRPLDCSGSAGLVWAINGGRLVELYRDWAVIDLPVNRSQRMTGETWSRRKSFCPGTGVAQAACEGHRCPGPIAMGVLPRGNCGPRGKHTSTVAIDAPCGPGPRDINGSCAWFVLNRSTCRPSLFSNASIFRDDLQHF